MALSLVNVMRANGHGLDGFALNVECRPQIAGDVHRVNSATILSRKLMNLVRSQARIEWVGLENPKGLPRGSLLDFWEPAPTPPKRPCRAEAIFH